MQALSFAPMLNVRDCAASIVFYRDKLGFTLEASWPDGDAPQYARLTNGPVELMLNQPEEPLSEPSPEPYGGAILFLRVASVHELHRELIAKGCTPREPTAETYGIDEMHLRDPDGYWLGFSSPRKV